MKVRTKTERSEEALNRSIELMKSTDTISYFTMDMVARFYGKVGPALADLYVRGQFAGNLFPDEKRDFATLLKIIAVLKDCNLPKSEATFLLRKLKGFTLLQEGLEDGEDSGF